MTSKLAGKVALVTGGSSGIGFGIAKHFAEEGARVFIVGRRQSQLDQAVAAIGGDAAAIQGDISNLADLDRIYTIVSSASRAYRCAGGKCRGLRIRQARGDHRGAVRQDVQHGRARPAVHCTKGVTIAEQGFLGDPYRLDGVDQRLRLLLGVQRVKSRSALIRAYLDRRSQGARHPRQRVEPRIHRYTGPLPVHDG